MTLRCVNHLMNGHPVFKTKRFMKSYKRKLKYTPCLIHHQSICYFIAYLIYWPFGKLWSYIDKYCLFITVALWGFLGVAFITVLPVLAYFYTYHNKANVEYFIANKKVLTKYFDFVYLRVFQYFVMKNFYQ